MTNSEKLRLERAKVASDMAAIVAKAEAENRNLNTEERSAYEKMKADVMALKERFERMEENEKLERELDATRGRIVDPMASRSTVSADKRNVRESAEYRDAFGSYLRFGNTAQFRDLNIGTPGDGGYTVPTNTASTVVESLAKATVMRKAGASVLATSVNTVIPIVGSISGGTWEPEADPFANGGDSDPTFTAFNANAFKFTAGTKLSRELLADSAIDVEALLTKKFVEAWATASDSAYFVGAGSGSNQPTGLMSGATAKTVASSTTFTAKELRETYYAVPQQYRLHLSFAFVTSDATLSFIAGMNANSNSDFLWQPGLIAGEPDRLMGKPIYSSDAIDTAYTTGKELLVCGAFAYYQIVDRINQFGVERLNELYAATGQVGFIGSWRTDGKTLVGNAFRKLKLA